MSEPWEDVDTGVGKRGIGIESPSRGRLQGIPVRFGRIRALLLLEAGELPGDRTACPTRSNELLPEPGRPFRRVY